MIPSRELLSEENRRYVERAREVAEKYVLPRAAEWDRTGEYPWAAIEALREYDLMGVWIPKEYGGHEAGLLNLCLVVEELSRVCGAVGVAYMVNALGSFPIILGGTEAQKRRYLPAIARGEKLIAFCLSEYGAGSDAGSLKTQAVRDRDAYVITGDKKWTTNADAASIYTVYATTDPEKGTRGISAFIVEKGMDGFIIGKKEDKMGIRAVPVHETHFRACRVPKENLLGEQEGTGFYNAMMTLDRARPGVAAQAVGLAQGAFELAAEWVSKRVQFGQPLIAQEAVQFMLADMATAIEAARQLVYAAAQAADQDLKTLSVLSAMCKVFASDVAMRVATDAVQLLGGYGYVREYMVEKYMRDAKITQIYEGTNQIQRLVIARHIVRWMSGRDGLLSEFLNVTGARKPENLRSGEWIPL
ncbi:MAG: acyl-CoA dehydrogenase family protein [Acidobacteriota bacterium]|nr:acyl-CoA dehydrogenase family protein [Acidobacteriota bacterium]